MCDSASTDRELVHAKRKCIEPGVQGIAMGLCVFAFGCHPDDIEILMSGTLFLLKEAGAEIHYMNPANGSLGTTEYDREEIIRIRKAEGMNAAALLGAEFHESIADDCEILYDPILLRKVAAVVREVQPDIMLLLSPEDYMEDHMNAVKLGYTAAFCRGMRNFQTIPGRSPYLGDIALYHAMPYPLCDMLNAPIEPHFYVDVENVINNMKSMLAEHKSQKKWLDESQGLDAYIVSMTDRATEVGKMSGKYRYAEGWRKHNHTGFCQRDSSPLEDALKKQVLYVAKEGTSRRLVSGSNRNNTSKKEKEE